MIDRNPDDDDRALLLAARAGDEYAFARLLAPHRRGLAIFCGLMLGDVMAADRALSETVLEAWSDVDAVRSPGSVKLWVFRIAGRVCSRAIDSEPMSFEDLDR